LFHAKSLAISQHVAHRAIKETAAMRQFAHPEDIAFTHTLPKKMRLLSFLTNPKNSLGHVVQQWKIARQRRDNLKFLRTLDSAVL
jgi:hypothetical protein